MPGRAHHLVAREGEEVDAEVGDRDRGVGHQLRAVAHHDRTGGVRGVGHHPHRVDGAEHVRHARHADELHPVDQRGQIVEDQTPVTVDRDVTQVETTDLLGQDHPRHDVGVVLHLGQEHGVARLQVGPAPRVGHQVQRLGRVLGEDDLAGRFGRADEAAGHHPGPLVERGRLLGRGVDATVHVGVGRLVVAGHRADDRLRLQRGGGRVEVDDRSPVDRAGQQREVLAQGLHVERGRRRAVHRRRRRHRHTS